MTDFKHGPALCPICGHQGTAQFRAGDFFYQVTPYQAELFCCDDCGSMFQWPIPGRELLTGFYPSGYWQEIPSVSLMARLQQHYVRSLLKADLMQWVKRMKPLPQGIWLDIGCSRGDWLALIREAGYQVAGLEADPRAAQTARDRFFLEVEQTDVDEWTPKPQSYAAISFFHLLEHLRKPAKLLKSCHTALIPGGKILLRVPNIASWQYRLCGQRWKGLELPRHLVLFRPKSLADLLDRSGFKVLSQATWSLRDGPPGLSSSLFPRGEPTRQQILGQPRPLSTLAYLVLTWAVTPLEIIAALVGQGSMITVIAEKK